MALVETPLEVFAWGKGEDGRCGHGCEASQLVPRSVLFSSAAAVAISIVEIGAGSDHTLARGSDGRVYSFGLGGQGEESKGKGNAMASHATPRPQCVWLLYYQASWGSATSRTKPCRGRSCST